MTKYPIIVGQFLLRDFTVLKTMLTAVVVGGIGVYTLRAFGLASLHVKPAQLVAVSRGGLVFGVGMVLLGYCPGTGVAAAAEGKTDALLGVVGMMCGTSVRRAIRFSGKERSHLDQSRSRDTPGTDSHARLGDFRRFDSYVFASPEAAEHAFAITTGKIKPVEGERADLIYSRFSHPNAEILEDQIVPLEAGAREAAVFNSGMAAIMTAFFTFAQPNSAIVYTAPLYGGAGGFRAGVGTRGVTKNQIACYIGPIASLFQLRLDSPYRSSLWRSWSRRTSPLRG